MALHSDRPANLRWRCPPHIQQVTFAARRARQMPSPFRFRPTTPHTTNQLVKLRTNINDVHLTGQFFQVRTPPRNNTINNSRCRFW